MPKLRALALLGWCSSARLPPSSDACFLNKTLLTIRFTIASPSLHHCLAIHHVCSFAPCIHSLSGNQIGPQGATVIAEALKFNAGTLKSFKCAPFFTNLS